jgi:hypothetical protein
LLLLSHTGYIYAAGAPIGGDGAFISSINRGGAAFLLSAVGPDNCTIALADGERRARPGII